jgi:hypothetical protein
VQRIHSFSLQVLKWYHMHMIYILAQQWLSLTVVMNVCKLINCIQFYQPWYQVLNICSSSHSCDYMVIKVCDLGLTESQEK